ncbi:MAG: hypothetical protein ACRC1P_11000 [Cellulosilyticaceae bacterium]
MFDRSRIDARTRANARLLSAGRYTIDEVVPENSRVDVYLYAIATYGFDLGEVDARYVVEVEKELGIVK